MEERLDKLETQVAFQEDLIEQLNQVIIAQADRIDALAGEEARLRDDMARGSEAGERDPLTERPPHY